MIAIADTILRGVLVISVVAAGAALSLAAVDALLSRRRARARAVSAGVPRHVLRRAMLIEGALPSIIMTIPTVPLSAVVALLVLRHQEVESPAFPWAGVVTVVLGLSAATLVSAWCSTLTVSEATDVRELRTT